MIAKLHGIPTEYKLFWDADNNWFGYKDVTAHPPASETDEPEYEPGDEPEYEQHYEPQAVSSAESASATATDELFYYEEEIVVGS